MPIGLTKEQIQTAMLDMLRKDDARSLNMRKLARHLGCAHTNLYNYYPSYDHILWDAVDLIYLRLYLHITENYENVEIMDISLPFYFLRVTQFFLDNKGWFRLIWQEPIKPDALHTAEGNFMEMSALVANMLSRTMQEKYGLLGREQKREMLRTVHSFLYGELMLYLNNKLALHDDIDFENHAMQECTRLLDALASIKRETIKGIMPLELEEME